MENKNTPGIVRRPISVTENMDHLNELRKALGYDKLSYESIYNLLAEKFLSAEIQQMIAEMEEAKETMFDKYLK